MKFKVVKVLFFVPALIPLAALSLGLAVSAQAADCGGAYERIAFNPDWPDGGYMRVDPNGEFLILSGQNSSIIQIKDNANPAAPGLPKRMRTQMNDEAYPVDGADGSWKFVASPNHGNDGMRYYDFKEIRTRPRDTTLSAAFSDNEFNQIYQSTGTLEGSTATSMKVRTALASPAKTRDYTLTIGADGKVSNIEKGPIKPLCANFGSQNFERPMLSRDGKELAAATFDAASNKSTTKIFKIKDDGNCDLVEDLGYNTSKVNWSYPEAGKKGMLTFTASSIGGIGGVPSDMVGQKVFVYDRDTKRTTPVSTEGWVEYGGFTKNNKVIYQSDNNGAKGVTIADISKVKAGCGPAGEGSGAAPGGATGAPASTNQ